MTGRTSFLQYARFCVRFYAFGLSLGLKNLWVNGSLLGWKKAIGKITQPVNAPDRFPECFLVWQYLHCACPTRILDLSSPKLLALFTALRTPRNGSVTATDLVDEYLHEWEALARLESNGGRQSSRLGFERVDARSLPYAAGAFDLAYSVSVLEHIPDRGHEAALHELVRVVRQGGHVVLTVPFAASYREEFVDHAVYERAYTGLPVFFQRVYDRAAIERWLEPLSSAVRVVHAEVVSERLPIMRPFLRLHENVRGALGPLSLVVALGNYRVQPLWGSDNPVHARSVSQVLFLVLEKL